MFADEDLDCLVITETWQLPSIDGKMNILKPAFIDFCHAEGINTKMFAVPRPTGRRGGGVAVLFKESLRVSCYKVDCPAPVSFEMLTVKITTNSSFVLVCLYRSQTQASFPRFLSEFRNLLISLSSINLQSVIAGDFNIWLNDLTNVNTQSFLRLLSEYNLTAMAADGPTHRDGNTLDFLTVFQSFACKINMCHVDDSVEDSDHYPVFFNIESEPFRPANVSVQQIPFRRWNTLHGEEFGSILQNSLTPLLEKSYNSFSEGLSDYRSTIASAVDLSAPLQIRTVRKSNIATNPPWMDAEYIHQRSIRKRLQKTGNKAAYNRQRRYCAYLAKTKKKAFIASSVSSAAVTKNQGELFKVLNKITDREKNVTKLPEHDDKKALADNFNSFFRDKVLNIRQGIPPSEDPGHPDTETEPSVESGHPDISSTEFLSILTPTDSDEILKLIKEHGVKIGPGDKLTRRLILEHIDILLPHPPVNPSLATSSCDGLKEAHVVPIIKAVNLDEDQYKNYRPVSLLSFISKLTERVVHNRINAHLTINDLNTPSQYGYKRHHSCETLLLKLVDDILLAVDRKFGVVVLIIDLSAAFDTVDHKLLLNILRSKYKIVGSALEWVKCFLTNRTQRVKIGKTLSDSLTVLFGVAQGSILGPLLFNLYCASICEVFQSCGFMGMGYADDNIGSRIFPAATSLSTLGVSIPNCLRQIKKWANSHFLKINSEKTQVIVFGNNHFHSSFHTHTVMSDTGSMIPISKAIKLLGFNLDAKLTLDDYISNIVSSSNWILRNIQSIRKLLDKDSAETLIHCLITSKLDACNSLFPGMSRRNFAKLQLVQNTALRVVLQLRPHAHVSPHFVDLHWLRVEERSYFKLLSMVFKCINNMAPSQLASKIRIRCPMDMLLETRHIHLCSAFGKRSFTYLAPRCWNALPRDIRLLTALEHFKACLKSYLFEHFRSFCHRVNPYTTTAYSQTGSANSVFFVEPAPEDFDY